MNYGCCNRRHACAIVLAIERDFTLDVPVDLQNDQVYRRRKKSDIPDENLFASTNKMSRKVVGSTAISWIGATKPFFVNENGIKVNKEIIVNI